MKKWLKNNLLLVVAILAVTGFFAQQVQAQYVAELPTYFSDYYYNGTYAGAGARQYNYYGTNGNYSTTVAYGRTYSGAYEVRATYWYYNGAWRI